jgi:GH18 family chitinase
LKFSKNAEESFISIGFDNWKKSKERFKKHEKSHSHRESAMKLLSTTKSQGVDVDFFSTAKTPGYTKTGVAKTDYIFKVSLKARSCC